MQARPEKARQYGLAALNRALDGVTGTTAVHICFGYAAIIHERPSGYSFLPELAQCSCRQVSIETAQSQARLLGAARARRQADDGRLHRPVRSRGRDGRDDRRSASSARCRTSQRGARDPGARLRHEVPAARDARSASCGRWSRRRRSCAPSTPTRRRREQRAMRSPSTCSTAGRGDVPARGCRPAHKACLAESPSASPSPARCSATTARRWRQPAGHRLRDRAAAMRLARGRALHARRRLRRSELHGVSQPLAAARRLRAEAAQSHAPSSSSRSRLPRVVFGAGALRHLPRELAALGIGRALVVSTPGQRALAERVAALLGGQSAGVFAQRGDARAGRGRARRRRRGATSRRRRRGRDRRRLDDRARQGARARARPAGRRRADDLRRQRGDVDATASPRPALKKTGARPARAAAHRRSTTRSCRSACRSRSPSSACSTRSRMPPKRCTRPMRNPVDRPDGRGRHPRRRRRARPAAARPARHRRARRRARRRLAVRHRARQHHDRPAPQALPHPRRQLRPAARRGARGRPAARARLQRAGGARRDGADRARALRRRDAARRAAAGAVRPRPRAHGAPISLAAIGMRARTSTAPPTWRCRTPTPIPGRSSAPRSARCCSAPSTALGREPVSAAHQAVSRLTPFSSHA